MSEFKHLPADVQAALDQYDADVADGTILFDDTGMACQYPGREAADRSLRDHVASHVRFLMCAVALVAMLAACNGQQTADTSCPRPALLANGQYSSYQTSGTMPSGFSVLLSDGDTWTCTDGHVTVH